LILYNQEYLDYISIIRNIFIYSYVISLLLEGNNSLLFIVLIRFFEYKWSTNAASKTSFSVHFVFSFLGMNIPLFQSLKNIEKWQSCWTLR